jgi:PPM family protein phosphatase
MTRLEYFQLTDAGAVRERNEDAVGHWPHDGGLVFAVADGLGGRGSGHVASDLALAVLGRELTSAPQTWPMTKRLRRAVQQANLELHQKTLAVPDLSGMATTLTATAIVGATLVAAHVGDTRLYLRRENAIRQLTKDHTWVAEQVAYGLLSPEQARSHPRRNQVTRCLGRDLIVGVDVLTIDVQPGDVLVQCSDGVHRVLDEPTIAALAGDGSAEAACRSLVRRALEHGSDDNVSAQVAIVDDCPPPAPRPWWRLRR